MGVKVRDIFPDALFPVFMDTMMYDNHDMYLSMIKYNSYFVYDWTRGIREIICDIRLGEGIVCSLVHNTKAEPGLQFKRKTGEVIGVAPFKDDFTGIRDDIEYNFLEIEPPAEFPGYSSAGNMQSIRLTCS